MLPYLIVVGLGAVLSACSSDSDRPRPARIPYPENIPPPPPKKIEPSPQVTAAEALNSYQMEEGAEILLKRLTGMGIHPELIDQGSLYLSSYPNQGNSYISGKGDKNLSLKEAYNTVFDGAHTLNNGFLTTSIGFDYFRGIEKEILSQPEQKLVYGFALANHPNSTVSSQLKSIQIFSEAVREDPQNGNRHWDLGYAYHVHGSRTLALSSYLRAVALKPDISSLSLEGLLLEMQDNGEMEQAIATLLVHNRAYPEDVRGRYFLGKAQKIAGRFKHAKATLGKVLKTDSSHSEARIALGDIHFQLEEYDQAARLYQRAVQGQVRDSGVYYRLAEILEHRGGALNMAHALELRTKGLHQAEFESMDQGLDE